MTSHPIQPCVWLDDQAEQAAAFYVRIFPRSRIIATSHYPEGTDNPSGRPRGSVLTVEAEVGGLRFTLLNGGPLFAPNSSVSFFVHVDARDEADRLFSAIADGG